MHAGDLSSELLGDASVSKDRERKSKKIPAENMPHNEAEAGSPPTSISNNGNDEKEQPPPKSILVVEDDEAIGEFILLALSLETAYRAVLAKDGPQALELARGARWDLFILDYLLSGIDGFALYDQLHAIPGLESTPALILSAANVPQEEIERRNLYSLTKPIELDEFLAMISKIVLHDNEQVDTHP